jgi:hypothetical protein
MIRVSKMFIPLAVFLFALTAHAQNCLLASDLDPAMKSAIQQTAQQLFNDARTGNVTALQQNAIPSLASSFAGVQAAVAGNKENFANAQATIRNLYLLDANGPDSTGEFYCGVFGATGQTATSAAFMLKGIPQGKYAVVIQDVKGGKSGLTVTEILQNLDNSWKLAGFYVRPTDIAGHDANWFLSRARQFKAAGQNHNAWFYYLAAWNVTAPVDFMDTKELDALSQEMQSVHPNDLPSNGHPVQLAAGGKTYNLTEVDAFPVGNDLDLRVRYSVPSVASAQDTLYKDNMAVIQAIVAKYPEFRQGFAAVIARAVDSTGQDYGTLLAMDKVK